MSDDIVIGSDALRVAVRPAVGGTLTEIRHRSLGSVLGTVPWPVETTPLDHRRVDNEPLWLTRFTGGWPLLFPNGGDACTFDGVFHGFHGEASISYWNAEARPDAVRLTRRFETVPVEMERVISVAGDVLSVAESVRMHGSAPIAVMWGQHATFGSDLLAGEFAVETGARRVHVDALYDPPANPLKPSAVGGWPMVPGKAGPMDLRHPGVPMAALAYLGDFPPAAEGPAWAGIRRLDGSIAAVLSWDSALFPCAWYWIERGATQDAPWAGQGDLIGLEPCTTWPGYGLATAAKQGGSLLSLQPGQAVAARFRLQVFKPAGSIGGVDREGRAIGA